MTGISTAGKPVNLGQLQQELSAGGLNIPAGLGMHDEFVYTYDGDGEAADFAVADQLKVQEVLGAHAAMRDKTDEEYAVEFNDANTSPQRKQEIRDQMNGLVPREQVPMT